MKSAVITKAQSREVNKIQERPSRRGYSDEQAWWQTNQDMPRTVLAHAVTDNPTEQLAFLDAMLLEADWGLGRNPLNMIQMTTATTELADKRSVENCYTSGRDDGVPGLHPGHTPYLNTEGWGGTMVGSNPKKVLDKFYPGMDDWPHASKYINTRYIWAHSEFTPRQTMRGKTLLYAYLYSLSQSGGSITPALIADAGQDQSIVDQDQDGKETVQLDGSGSYSSTSEITSYEWNLSDSTIATGKTTTVELDTDSYEIILKVQNAEETARDTVRIDIIAQSSDQKADYDFETADQLDDWIVENFGQDGGVPIASHSTEKARGGAYSFEIEGNFVPSSEHALRRNSSLQDSVISLIYHIWVPQALVDSAHAVYERDSTQVGGLQNYLMHNGWQWISEWYSIKDLKGDDWNELELKVPGNVENSKVQSIGVSFKMMGVNIGKAAVYIDDIYFIKGQIPASVHDPKGNFAEIPADYKLFHNYPNPFNPETKIRYNLPRQTQVKINVYDIVGRHVKTLVDDFQDAGSYHVVFDGSHLASGVYIYALEAGPYKNVRKMILLK